MTRFLAKKLVFLPLLAAIVAVIGIFGYIARANNDIVVFGKLWQPGMSFWDNTVNIEPGGQFKITLFAGNYSATQAVTNVKIVDSLPANTSYLTASSYQILINDGVWLPLPDDGTSPFDGTGLDVTADGALAAQEFANYKYTVTVPDFLPSGTAQLAWAGPTLYFTDSFGSQTKGNSETTAINVSNLPTISSIALSPAQAYYKLGDVIVVTMIGVPGKTASLKIGSITVNLTEAASGTYTGAYTVQSGDNLSATPRAYLVNANAKGAYKDYAQTITLDTVLPGAPTGLGAVLNPDSSVKLIWLAPADVSDVNHYNIYSNNGVDGVNYSSPIATVPVGTNQYTTTPLASDALYKFAVRSVDAAGNIETNTMVVTKSTDVTPPDPPASLVAPTSLNNTVLKFNASNPLQFVWISSPSADLAKYRLEIDDSSDFSSIITSQDTVGTTTSYSLLTSTIILPEGLYFWRALAIDDADLVSTPTVTPDNSFEIDNTAPTVLVSQPSSGGHINGNFTASGAGADSGAHLNGTTGIAKVEVFLLNFITNQYWNGGAWVGSPTFLTATTTNEFTAWTYPFTATITNNTFYVTGARITDKAGNSTDSALINLVGDTVAPTVNLVTITNTTLGSTVIFKNTQNIVLTATITDNLGQGGMGVDNIHADLSAITGNAGDNAVVPASYNTTSGLATWTAVVANASGDGAKSVTITTTDLAANNGAGSNSIIADNTAPTITAATLTSPSATGIAWAGGSVKTIAWNQAEITDTNLAINPITLEYTTDGATWTQIATNEANDGAYAWTLPSLNTATVRVRLTAKDTATNTATDNSDNNFSIDSMAPAFANTVLTNSTLGITTLVKNGDTVVLTSDITDNLLQAGLTVASFTADFSAITNNPADNAVSPASYNTGNGATVWNFKTVAGTGNGALSINITATDPAGNAAAFTNTAIIIADNAAPTITINTLTTPSAAGITWPGGAAQNITWNNAQIADTHLAANPILLEYTTDGTNYTTIASNEANDGSYAWTVPSLNSQTVKIRITARDNAANTSNDISDNNFTIDSTAPMVPTTALTAPNGAEAWKQGTLRSVTWDNGSITDNFGLAANPITLEYTTDGSTWNPIAANETNDGSYSWTTPVIDSTTVKVRIIAYDAAGNTANDQSDNNFSIGLPPTVFKAWAESNTLIQIEWDKPLSSAGAFANYTATGITATAATINGGDNKVVDLTVNALNNTGFTATDLAVVLNTVTDTFNFQNEATSTVAIGDHQDPQVSVSGSYPNSNQLIVDFTPSMRIAVSEAPGGSAVFELDGVAKTIGYNAGTKEITYPVAASLAAGKHTLSLDMVDLAGNTAANQTWNFWIDSFSTTIITAPIAFIYNGNSTDETDVTERQQITVSTYGAGFKVYALFQPDFGDGQGNFITDVDMKLAADPWTSKIDLNGTNQVQLASVAKAGVPSLSAVETAYTFDLRATIDNVLQAAGDYQGTLQFIVVPEY